MVSYSSCYSEENRKESIQPGSQSELSGYWTKERMRNAKPVIPPEVSESEFRELLEPNSQLPRMGPSGELDSGSVDGVPLVATPPRANLGIWPFKSGGKLFFSKDGSDWVCSAQFVGHFDVILTAAHCLRKRTGEWHSNLMFRLRYENGNYTNSFSSFHCLSTYKAWIDEGYKWDYGFLNTTRRNNTHLGWYTGIPSGRIMAMGYPGRHDAGQYMLHLTGYRGEVTNGVVQLVGGRLGRGSSGGAWSYGQRSDRVLGINSFSYRNSPNDSWSPDIDNNFVDLMDWTHRGCR